MTAIAGNEVDAWCTKCRMDLNHRVVAAVGGAPKRVECLTCHTQHNYRAPKGVKAPIPKGEDVPATSKKASSAKAPKATKSAKGTKGSKGTKGAKGAKGGSRSGEWDKRVSGQLESSFTAYTPRATFKVDELVRHSKFGDGFVSEVDPDGKIAVIFQEGAKTLVHGR